MLGQASEVIWQLDNIFAGWCVCWPSPDFIGGAGVDSRADGCRYLSQKVMSVQLTKLLKPGVEYRLDYLGNRGIFMWEEPQDGLLVFMPTTENSQRFPYALSSNGMVAFAYSDYVMNFYNERFRLNFIQLNPEICAEG